MPEETTCDFDVFISYSSQDKTWVRGELLKRIEQAGLKAFIDYRDFTRGAPSIKECERGVVKCRKTLIILTPNYLGSGWAELENIMVQTLDPANETLRLIPLLKAHCKKPLRIGTLTHIDFTEGADLELAWRQLLTALGKPPELEPPKEPERKHWFLAHPYPMPPNFTGRKEERGMLTQWLETDEKHPLLVVRALGGFGKSALAWHWLLQDVKPAHWPRVVWWSFYEGDASFEHFLAETLHYLSGGQIKLEKVSGNDLRTLLEWLHSPGTLLVLDGFERVLRAFSGLDAAYQGDAVAAGVPPAVEGGILPPSSKTENSRTHKAAPQGPPGGTPGATAGGDARRYQENDRDCVSPLAEVFLRNVALLPHLKAKVLMTTRLSPRVLEAKGGGFWQGCKEVELKRMQPADAVAFFHAQGIRGTHTEIETACERYGYHPLSLRLLAGLIMGDFQLPGDITAAQRLDVSGDLIQQQNHVLQVAYDSLTPERKVMLGQIACFRSPVKYEMLKSLAEAGKDVGASFPSSRRETPSPGRLVRSLAPPNNLDADLRDLVGRGLLHHEVKEGRFDLHPIVRRYAYDRLADTDRTEAHTRLRDYFAAVPKVEKVTRLEDLLPVIELYHHTVRAGQFDEALILYLGRLRNALYYQLGAYQLIIDLVGALFQDGENRPPRMKDENAQGWAMAMMALAYSLSGQPRRAVPLHEHCNKLSEKLGDKRNLGICLGNLAYMAQINTGALREAEANLRRSIKLCREIKNFAAEATSHQQLGRLFAYLSRYVESERELATALKMDEDDKHLQGQGLTWACQSQREQLRQRSLACKSIADHQSPIALARRALELGDEDARTTSPVERDYVRTHWLLGAAHRVAGHNEEAEQHLNEALERCRRINLVDNEADILIDLARLRVAMGAPEEARRLAEEALLITERSGYVLQGADAQLELAKLALSRGEKDAARDHARQAKTLATCDGPPDYTYKVAYDEAVALLKQLGDKN